MLRVFTRGVQGMAGALGGLSHGPSTFWLVDLRGLGAGPRADGHPGSAAEDSVSALTLSSTAQMPRSLAALGSPSPLSSCRPLQLLSVGGLTITMPSQSFPGK